MKKQTMNDKATPTALRIPATYMRGGTSKGLLFRLEDLPNFAQQPGVERNRLLQRIMGSPDPLNKQIDGMGGATSSTSKVAIVSSSEQPDHDVDYLFGQVAFSEPLIDWSGNCGNLTAAVAAFAIHSGLLTGDKIPHNGVASVRIWQKNIGKTILAQVPITNGQVQEAGDFVLDGVAFPAAPIQLEFLQPGAVGEQLFPSGQLLEQLELKTASGSKRVDATLITAGIPAVLVDAMQLGLTATELESDINGNPELLQQLESLRSQGALRMGLIDCEEQARQLQHTPKIVWLAAPRDYRSSSKQAVAANDIDVCARALSMGKLHHAMMASAAVAMASAAAIPGTLLQRYMDTPSTTLRLGHTSGLLSVGAEAQQGDDGNWQITHSTLTRSARIIMEGWVRVPSS